MQMERALLERCPNTLLRRRAAEAVKVGGSRKKLQLFLERFSCGCTLFFYSGRVKLIGEVWFCAFQSQVQPRITVAELALTPKRGLRPIATAVATPISTRIPVPCYTSLAEIIPTPGSPMVERIVSPRTPMRNRLVEKAARAYLLPSDSFNKRRSESAPWTQSFSRFLPRLSVLTMALNPFNAFSSAFQVFRCYVTGARALQPQLSNSVSRSVSRSISMPIQRTSYSYDLSIR